MRKTIKTKTLGNPTPRVTHSLTQSLSPLMAKRLCWSSPGNMVSDPTDRLLESFLSLPTHSLNLSFDRLVDSQPSDSDQIDAIDRATTLGSALLQAAKRRQRSRATSHNYLAWSLPADLTIKIFSMMDTQSVCYAAATSSFFRKCAEDPVCYANIDLVTESPKVNNLVVSTLIQRAGKALWSLRLGIIPRPFTSVRGPQPLINTTWNDTRSRQGKETPILTRSCLISLSRDGCVSGSPLTRLHLYNIERIDNAALDTALSGCPSIHELKIVGVRVDMRQTLDSVSKHCHLIEHLDFGSSETGRDDSLKLTTCNDLVSNCPHLTFLALKGFKLHDGKIRVLVKGLRKLKYIDFSTSYSITGTFLRNLGTSAGGGLLEVVILRDCMHLKEVEVSRFLTAVVGGDFKLLKHLDISNREGLASEGDWYNRCYSKSFIPAKQLFEGRPGLRLVAQFPVEVFSEMDPMISSGLFSFDTSSSQTSSQTSDGAMHLTLSDSSHNSEPSSGNDDVRDRRYVVYEESSDEVDFFS